MSCRACLFIFLLACGLTNEHAVFIRRLLLYEKNVRKTQSIYFMWQLSICEMLYQWSFEKFSCFLSLKLILWYMYWFTVLLPGRHHHPLFLGSTAKRQVQKLQICGICDNFVYTENCMGKSPFIKKSRVNNYHLK